MITVSVTDGMTPVLNGIVQRFQRPRAMMAALGKQLEVDLRLHFLDLDRRPNAMGWPSKHFWKRTVAGATALTEITDNSATVTVASAEFAHKLTRSTVTAKTSKMLAIPLTAEAYKADRARLFPRPLFVLARKGEMGRAFLAERKGKKETLAIQFMLLASVTHQPDPQAMPDMTAIRTNILLRAQDEVARLTHAAG